MQPAATPPPGGPDGPEVEVRPARLADCGAVGAVQASVFRQVYADVLPEQVLAAFDPDAFAQAWRQSLAAPPSPQHLLLVATEGGLVVGMAALTPSADPDLIARSEELPATGTDTGTGTRAVAGHPGPAQELTLLAVAPTARGRGHGSRLVNAAADLSRQGGASTLVAWPLAQDGDLIHFLERAGFGSDGATRSREVPGGDPAREQRLVTGLG